ncbi:MAG: putative nucleotide-binding protein, containing PIN domain [Methanosaeta sp. PtaU1.Bin112]|nr:MAG: putative nucleotide-binding protein, containing PIN domain [Methanosaeta sp. PtaU1.Bin112]
MEIVLDTNILISSLLRNGLTRDIILLSPLKMYTVEYAKFEVEKHKDELQSKSKLDEDSFNYLTEFVFGKVSLIPMAELSPFKDKAIGIMREIDINDSPFIALAMHLNCPIWSNDAHFKRQNVIKSYTTKELINLLL